MAEAGCEGVFLGIESGSDAMLKVMNKTAKRAEYAAAISQLKAAGILTYASLIVGFPGETRQTLRETIDFLETTGPDFYRAQLWYCDPITPIWNRRDEFGITGQAFRWSHATMSASEACQAIDEMFFGIKGSLWMPQFGFELWSTFYLQRHGFSVAQVKDFVAAFNAGVKEQMVAGYARPLPEDIVTALRSASRVTKGETHDPQAISRGPTRLRERRTRAIHRLRSARPRFRRAVVFGMHEASGRGVVV